MRLVPVSFEDPEFKSSFSQSFSLYVKYQMAIHQDPPDECGKTEVPFTKRFFLWWGCLWRSILHNLLMPFSYLYMELMVLAGCTPELLWKRVIHVIILNPSEKKDVFLLSVLSRSPSVTCLQISRWAVSRRHWMHCACQAVCHSPRGGGKDEQERWISEQI